MFVAALLDSHLDLSAQIGWAVRLASSRDRRLILLVSVPRRGETGATDVGPDTDPEELPKLAVDARSALVALPGVRLATTEEVGAAEDFDEVLVTLRLVHDANVGRGLLSQLSDKTELLVLFCEQLEISGNGGDLRRFLGGRVTCELMVLRLGQVAPEECRKVLVPAARRLHAGAALDLGHDVATAQDGTVTAVYVEPEVGPDAEAVGRRIIDRLVAHSIGKDRDHVETRVVVANDVLAAVTELCKQEKFDLVLLGASEGGALSPRARGSLPQRIMRAQDGPAVAIVRRGLPLANRLRAMMERWLTHLVPQLDRNNRIKLVERVQSNSQWDFDFITLMSLSAVIAGLGLLSNSAAVVIGAMLVAPLMTPLLGVGLALVQGNPVLVRLSVRSIMFGFLMALLLSTLLGFLQPGGATITQEMLGRGWPGMRELFVAFASGLAAAYATSRPGMVEALPGVAIAAALVPPIATCGLALSAGRFDLAAGACLLVVMNMVVIVFGATISLWSVGIRNVKQGGPWTSRTGATLIGLVIVLGVVLSFSPRQYLQKQVVPAALTRLVSERVAPGYRVTGMRVTRPQGTTELEVELGGSQPPGRRLAEELAAAAEPYFEGDVRVRLALRWEISSR